MSGARMYILGGAILAGAGVLGALWGLSDTTSGAPAFDVEEYRTLVSGSASRDTLETYWHDRIAAIGGNEAYVHFAEAVVDFNPGQQHEHAHHFGGALYEALRLDGLAVCDARFLYGCYHEFLGRAISERGLGIADELNQRCIDILGKGAHFCQHGIGHGLQAGFGYDEAALKKALAICRDLPENDPIGGCYGGIFMEYNLHTMLGDLSDVRESEDVFAPCNALERPYLRACHFWQPQWWMQYEPATEETMARIGGYCEEMNSDSALIRECFKGIGNMVAPAVDFEGDAILRLCRATSPTQRHASFCIAQGASRAVQGDGPAGARAICEQVTDPEAAERCHTHVAASTQ